MVIIALVLVVISLGLGLWGFELRKENKILKENFKVVKDSLNAIATKPIYAAVTDVQIEKLGQVIASYLHPKEWLN